MNIKLLLVLPLAITSFLFAGEWKPDTGKARISFSIKGPFGKVHGNFSGLKADIKFNEKDLGSSSVSASVEAKTVSTGVGLRNSDLRKKEEWFNAEKYPLISFHSKKIEKEGNGYKAIGELTMKGVTKSETIPFTFTGKGNTGIFKGQFNLKRQDYHLGKDGGSVGSEVMVSIEVPVKK